ncbi:hypothetical protein [Acidithiobacillus thiooxidans]|uniref:hypothetical protein n=1 Tax=Acidithiobacillus thiooxidans TaxID=930 RepID=UPI0004E21C86|nr:hypothetical protein [Acidithiobacillus thiooxidans]
MYPKLSLSRSRGETKPQEQSLELKPLVIITVGVTAAGKTTWAKNLQNEHPNLNVAIIPTAEISSRDQQAWIRKLQAAATSKNVIILDGSNLDDTQLRHDLDTLKTMGLTDIAIEYFEPDSLFVLLSRNKGTGGEKIRTELQKIKNREHYLEIADSYD